MALPLADVGEWGWRLVYVVTLIWLIVAVDISRRLPETVRYERPHAVNPPLDRRRFTALATVAACLNFFVAPASFFQNRYLREVRGFDASRIALFTLTTATPAALGLVVGGRLADIRGRRHLIAVAIPIATVLIVLVVRGRRRADVAMRRSAAGSSGASPTRRSRSTAPSCSRPATAAARRDC